MGAKLRHRDCKNLVVLAHLLFLNLKVKFDSAQFVSGDSYNN